MYSFFAKSAHVEMSKSMISSNLRVPVTSQTSYTNQFIKSADEYEQDQSWRQGKIRQILWLVVRHAQKPFKKQHCIPQTSE